MLKFVIFGCGKRGKRLLNILGEERVKAYIDNDIEKIDTVYNGIPIISLNTYIQKYRNYIIILTSSAYRLYWREEIIEQLTNNNVLNFIEMVGCPDDFICENNRKRLEEFPVFDRDEYNIYGVNIFTLLLCEKLLEDKKKVTLIPQVNWDSNKLKQITECIPFKAIIDEYSSPSKYKSIMRMIYTSDEDLAKVLLKADRIENYYDFSLKFKENYNAQILRLKKSEHKERCFIIACGPSLRASDLQILFENKEKCLSMNGIFKIFSETDWRPDYYMVTDENAADMYKDAIIDMEVRCKIITDNCVQFWQTVDCANIYKMHSTQEDFIDWLPAFSEDLEYAVTPGGTVTYSCIQLAVYLGFKEIYLLGVDCNFHNLNGKDKMYFTKDYINDTGYAVNHDGHEEVMIMAYQSAKKYADSHGIKIYNATRGGMLEVFERVNFDSLFVDKE
ncbi:MAG: DUF115 domain-containing protein [Lachnospiraceae bacterium]|nr:DUF115 domain-containing protein [Lachnospiraceae bacterium]